MSEATVLQAPAQVADDSGPRGEGSTQAVEPLASEMLDDVLYEVIEGRVVEKPAMGAYQALIATTLIGWLYKSGAAEQVGRPASEVLFKLDPGRNLKRRPDAAFVSYERWPRRKPVPAGDAWDVVPDLTVEVVSPTNTFSEMVGKIDEYFHAGVQLVWLIIPGPDKVYAYTSPTEVRILQPGDDLDGGPVIPGFRVPVKKLFEDED